MVELVGHRSGHHLDASLLRMEESLCCEPVCRSLSAPAPSRTSLLSGPAHIHDPGLNTNPTCRRIFGAARCRSCVWQVAVANWFFGPNASEVEQAYRVVEVRPGAVSLDVGRGWNVMQSANVSGSRHSSNRSICNMYRCKLKIDRRICEVNSPSSSKGWESWPRELRCARSPLMKSSFVSSNAGLKSFCLIRTAHPRRHNAAARKVIVPHSMTVGR